MTTKQQNDRIAELEARAAAAEARAAKAEAAAAAAAARQPQGLRLKVGNAGGVSLYGFTVKFPTTLYGAQWVKLFENAAMVLQFVDDHWDELKHKDDEARAMKSRIPALIKRFQ